MTNSSVKRNRSRREEPENDDKRVISFCSLVKSNRTNDGAKSLRITPSSRRSSVEFPEGVPTSLGRSPSG